MASNIAPVPYKVIDGHGPETAVFSMLPTDTAIVDVEQVMYKLTS